MFRVNVPREGKEVAGSGAFVRLPDGGIYATLALGTNVITIAGLMPWEPSPSATGAPPAASSTARPLLTVLASL
jgi:hypothetical protein